MPTVAPPSTSPSAMLPPAWPTSPRDFLDESSALQQLSCADALSTPRAKLAFVSVLITGTIANANIPASLGVAVGSKLKISFLTMPVPTDRFASDGSGVHVTDGIGGYQICSQTFAISFGDSSLKGSLKGVGGAPDPFLSNVSKRPVHDGVYISPSATVAKTLPIKMTSTDNMGIKLYPPDWSLDLSVIYARGTFPSLSMQDIAAQTYTSTGLLKSEFALSTSFATNLVLEASIDSIAFTMPERV